MLSAVKFTLGISNPLSDEEISNFALASGVTVPTPTFWLWAEIKSKNRQEKVKIFFIINKIEVDK